MIDIEYFLSKPCWIIDILPKQVPVGAAGQYFEIEKHFLSPPHIDAIYRKFAILLLKLNCYDDIAVYQVSDESWQENPAPSVLEQLVLERKPLLVVSSNRKPCSQSLATTTTWQCMVTMRTHCSSLAA